MSLKMTHFSGTPVVFAAAPVQSPAPSASDTARPGANSWGPPGEGQHGIRLGHPNNGRKIVVNNC